MTHPPKPAGLDSELVARIIKVMSKAQVAVFRATNGRIGGLWRIGGGFRKPVPVLLLDHVGRKSGRAFTTPLCYLRDAGQLVIVASQGGRATHPQWYFNLVARPDTTVQVAREGVKLVHARTANPGERAQLWPKLVGIYADFETYQSWTEREIPVVVLEPR